MNDQAINDSTEGVARGSMQQPGSVTPEQWWSHHAELLAVKMKLGGVQSFRIELNAKGNYEFEVTPTGWPNESSSATPEQKP